MTIESELRTAFTERAAQIPERSTTRLTQLDYHPRTRRLKAPVALGSLAGVGGTAGVILALTGGATNAFAGWKPKPTTPSAAQLAAAMVDCAKQLPFAGLPLKLTDTRGPFTFQVYANDKTNDTCISGPSFTSVSGMSASAPVSVPADRLDISAEHTTTRAGQAYGFAIGRAGSGVSAATFVLDDGTDVTGTIQNGWVVAWWPGAHGLKSAQLTTPSGVQTQAINEQSPCGAHLCTGGPHGQGTGPVTASSSGSVSSIARGSVTGSLSISK
jgi:hypothetical protein